MIHPGFNPIRLDFAVLGQWQGRCEMKAPLLRIHRDL
jgi:hypothetical protein